MKFDIIVGNPPYSVQSSGNKKNADPIYQHFLNLAYSVLNNNGSIIWIQQDTWKFSYKSDKSFQNMRSFLCSPQLAFIAMGARPWANVGVIVDWFHLVKGRSDLTKFPDGAELLIHSLNDLRFGSNKFLKKLLSVDHNGMVFNKTTYPPHAANDGSGAKVKSETHVYPVVCAGRFDGSNINNWTNAPYKNQFDKKVIFSLIRALRPKYDADGEYGLGSDTGAFLTESEEEANFVIELINSKPVQAVLAAYGDSDYSQKGMNAGKRNRAAEWIYKIPLNLNKWNEVNKDPNAYFDLTQEEIDLIEATVK